MRLFAASEFRTDINPALRYYQAYLKTPQLGSADHDYLFVPEWRGQKLDDHFGGLIGTYDAQFKFLRAERRPPFRATGESI